MPETKAGVSFDVFNEIGIIEQLSRAVLEAPMPAGLIAPYFTVLKHLIRLGDGRDPIDMARAFQVPKTTLTHALKGLEAYALIKMRPNPEVGRSKLVYLTAAGRSLRDRIVAELAPDFDRLSRGVDVARFSVLLPDPRALRQFLDEDRNSTQSRRVRPVRE